MTSGSASEQNPRPSSSPRDTPIGRGRGPSTSAPSTRRTNSGSETGDALPPSAITSPTKASGAPDRPSPGPPPPPPPPRPSQPDAGGGSARRADLDRLSTEGRVAVDIVNVNVKRVSALFIAGLVAGLAWTLGVPVWAGAIDGAADD